MLNYQAVLSPFTAHNNTNKLAISGEYKEAIDIVLVAGKLVSPLTNKGT